MHVAVSTLNLEFEYKLPKGNGRFNIHWLSFVLSWYSSLNKQSKILELVGSLSSRALSLLLTWKSLFVLCHSCCLCRMQHLKMKVFLAESGSSAVPSC